MSSPFSRITLIGLGLMGGSMARALKLLSSPPDIHGITTDPEDLDQALAAEVLDRGSLSTDRLPEDGDLVILATPLRSALTLMDRHGAQLASSGAVITDLVSLKAPLMAMAREVGLEERYVGSHPMAGGTGSGFGASRDDLFMGASVWMTPGESAAWARERVEALWTAVGARPKPIQAEDHDDLMTWVSHLPQLTSNALAAVLRKRGLTPGDMGPGGRDMTRLAESAPEMWLDLLEMAPASLQTALAEVGDELASLGKLLREGRREEMRGLMATTREWRRPP